MLEVNIKVLSVNDAWKGRRFKTDNYKQYERDLGFLLPNKSNFKDIDWKKPLLFQAEVGYSNSGSDIDNFLKPFTDILQKKYDFNDNKIFRMIIDKVIVKKGEEYIKFDIKNL